MYRNFRKLLLKAVGQNDWVVAINADIRGFTSVMSGDPAQTALYLRAVYGKIIDSYFKAATFAKPTGDGLLLVIPFPPTEKDLVKMTRSVVTDALRLHDDFADVIADDKLIKFPHPKKIGLGLAVGSVSRLTSGDTTLDYTGRPLNVASRLMDLARPSGVVVDSTLDFSAIASAARSRFSEDHVYLKGVAEQDGVDILYTTTLTSIPDRYRKPLRPYTRFEEPKDEFTRPIAKQRGSRWWMELSREPADRTQLEVLVYYPSYTASGKPKAGIVSWFEPTYRYSFHSGKPHLEIDFAEIAVKLTKRKVPAGVASRLEVAFPISDEDELEDPLADIPF